MKIKGLPYLGPLAAAAALTVFEHDLLYQLQEQNLFLHTPLFFQQQTVKAGGLLTWTGCYLTQFFHYPTLGAGLLCLLWAFFMWLQTKAFRTDSPWPALLPVACLLLTIADMGYWVFYQKLPGHAFVATVGCIVAVGLAWGYRRVTPRHGLAPLTMALTAIVGYPLFGFYGLLAVALMAATGRRMADACVAMIAIVGVPLIYYHTVYHETNIVNIYWTALPVYALNGRHYPAYYLPYAVLVAWLLMQARCQGTTPNVSHEGGEEPPELSFGCSLKVSNTIPAWRTWAAGGVAFSCLLLVALFWYKDDNFHRELSMSRSIEQHDWQQVLATARAAKGEPTRAICMMQNLALYRLDRPAEEMLSYPNGAKRPQAPFPVRLVHTYGKMLYLEYGIPNYCYRWCMEDGVEYGWTVGRLKLMALCSLLNGEAVAAQRMLNLLKKTDFHRSWARHYEAYLHNPRLVLQDDGLRPILPLLRTDNFLTADQSQQELFLIEHILSTPGTTHEQQELARRTAYYYKHNRRKLVEN